LNVRGEIYAEQRLPMASTAGQIPRDLFGFDFRRLVHAVCAREQGGIGGGLLAGDDLTTHAVASAGLAALFTLPLLLLSSAVLAAPLAAPAAIGLGYLAMSHALAAQHRRRAALINAVVLCGLIGWLLFFLLLGEGQLSRSGLMAALLAPLFAAAPAFARSIIATRTAGLASVAPIVRHAALDRVACLDEFAPSEPVLILDGEGTVLAATSATRKILRALPDAFEHHINSFFDSNDLPLLLGAIDRCKKRSEPIGVDLGVCDETPGIEKVYTAAFSLCDDGTVAMRLQEHPALEPSPVAVKEDTVPRSVLMKAAKTAIAPSCNIGEAVAFALRHAGPKAEAKKARLTSAVEADIAAACDRQVGRRILHHLIDNALNGSEAGGAVHVLARRLRGVVLLRVASELGSDASGAEGRSDEPLDVTALRSLVEGAGGTLIVDRESDEIVLSVRLDLAVRRGAEKRVDESVVAE
jgi:hypothetical protein